jgi:Ca2+-binding RTX toxin-like protein
VSALSTEDAMLFGGKGADTVTGAAGNDVLGGNEDGDVLSGGSGNDSLTGGQGSDTLVGGQDADHFVIAFALHSTPGGFDVIRDFVHGADRIDLSQIDANGVVNRQAHFTFIGSAAFGTDATGQLRYEYDGTTLMLYGSTDADAEAELAVQVMGVTALELGDLIL